MQRRFFIGGLVATAFAPWAISRNIVLADNSADSLEHIQNNWRTFFPDDTASSFSLEPITKTEEQWRAALPKSDYYVLFEEGTERPFSSVLNDEKRDGIYTCAACELPLFSSEMKFDSGTGWPSFFTHIPGHIDTSLDFKLVYPRTEYHCIRCGGHQGHVFKDGPKPTGERWCNNGVALRFTPA